MRTNPKVCVEVDEITNHFQWTSVVLRGRYRELPDLPPFAEERDHAWKLLRTRRLWWQPAYTSRQLETPRDVLTPLFYCIEIASMTGHRAAASVGGCESAESEHVA
jgi:nitroimidazol reductase NimA-like FMN-containing flavoprotein (pyridoxamine 5'-phosphate oxidase superfamily)